jgi:Na+/melibiose symporter-like transporter
MEEVLGFWALVLTMSMSFVIVVWLCCSIVDSLLKMRRRHKKVRYKALLRENQRLKQLLADTAKEHHFRKVHRTELVRRKSNRVGRSVA